MNDSAVKSRDAKTPLPFVASVIGIIALFIIAASLWFVYRNLRQRSAPVKLAAGMTFEIYTVAAAQSATTIQSIDPTTGAQLFLETPPILGTTDVDTVARGESTVLNSNGKPEPSFPELLVKLTPAGAAKMSAATANTASVHQKFAPIVNGKVVATPQVMSPMSNNFRISGDLRDVVDLLTQRP